MIKAIHFPLRMAGQELDDYLAKGWFRMGQTIFTTDFIPANGKIHPVYWLRYDLPRVMFGKKQQHLLSANKHFSVSVRPFRLTVELEELYAAYWATVSFDAPPTVENYLLDGEVNNIYESLVMEVRERNRLVAAGIFDNGQTSIAGIMNFYDPAYKSKSPGKYLMLQKILYGLSSGKRFYYPGYIAGGFPKFDYKLFPDPAAAEVYDTAHDSWLPLSGVVLKGAIQIPDN